jgi:stage III sporulation protein SpoIIIAA
MVPHKECKSLYNWYIFQEIMSTTFHECTTSIEKPKTLVDSLRKVCKEMKLECTEKFQCCVEQLYSLLNVRHGIILLGPPCAGKTTVYRVLASALASMKVYIIHTFITSGIILMTHNMTRASTRHIQL